MAEFIGICAKLYHYVLENSSVSSRHKGVSNMGMKNTASNNIPLTTIGSVNLFKDPNFEEEQYDPMTLLYRDVSRTLYIKTSIAVSFMDYLYRQ
jgi:hypothetical protein